MALLSPAAACRMPPLLHAPQPCPSHPLPAAFTVTPDRSLQVKFVFPAYFSSGAALFAPGGQVPGVEAWADLAGQTVTTLQGNYVLDVQQDTPELRNLTIVAVPSAQAAEQLILAGKAVAL